MTRQDVVIVHGFGDANLGGAAITLAAGDLARELANGGRVAIVPVNEQSLHSLTHELQPDVEVLAPLFNLTTRRGRLVSLAASIIYLVYPRMASKRDDFARLATADFVVAKGGYVFRQRSGLPGMIAGWFTMWPLMFAARCGVATVAHSASVGPFQTKASRQLSKFALRKVAVVCPREVDSLKRLREELRLSNTTVLMPDCVFGLAHDPRIGLDSQHQGVGSILTVVPRKMSEGTWPAFVEIVNNAISHSECEQVEIILQAESDVVAAKQLVADLALAEKRFTYVPSLNDAVETYRRSRMVVTGRLHGAIISALSGTPPLMFDIADESGKAKPVLADLGLEWAVVTGLETPQIVQAVVEQLCDPATRDAMAIEIARLAESVRDADRKVVVSLFEHRS